MKTKNKLSLIAMILGAIAAVIMFVALGNSQVEGSDAEALGSFIGTLIVLPSVIFVTVGVILNIIGYFTANRVITLISAIIYCVGFVLMPLWGFLAIPSLVLQFVAFAKMKKAAV